MVSFTIAAIANAIFYIYDPSLSFRINFSSILAFIFSSVVVGLPLIAVVPFAAITEKFKGSRLGALIGGWLAGGITTFYVVISYVWSFYIKHQSGSEFVGAAIFIFPLIAAGAGWFVGSILGTIFSKTYKK